MYKKIMLTLILIFSINFNNPQKILAEDTINYDNYKWSYNRVLEYGVQEEYFERRVKIAVIDSGIDNSNNSLLGKIVSEKNYTNSDSNDNFGHGTQIASIINLINPNVDYYSYKIMNSFSDGDSYNVIKAIYDAVDDKVDIINISMGTYKNIENIDDKNIIEEYQKAINFATSEGIFIVSSSGNDGKDLLLDEHIKHVPSQLDNVVSVGSTLRNGDLAPYSNYGDVDVVAPSGYFGELYEVQHIIDPQEMTLVQVPKESSFGNTSKYYGLPDGYSLSFGTSVSTAMVSGVISKLIEKCPEASKEEILSMLYNNSKDLGEPGYDKYYGYGEVRELSKFN